MKKQIVLLLVLVSSSFLMGQNIDSLKSAVKLAKNDTSRISLLKQIGETEEIFRVSYWDSLADQCESGLSKSKQNEKYFYMQNLAYALNIVGYINDEHGNAQTGLKYYQKSYVIYQKINDRKGMALALNNIGSIYENFGDIAKALDSYHSSLKIREQIKDVSGMAVCLNNIGLIYFKQNDFQKALFYYTRSFKLMEQVNDREKMAISLSNIGLVYKGLKNNKLAIIYYNRSLQQLDSVTEKYKMISTLNNIAAIYQDDGNYEEALKLHQKNLVLENEFNNRLTKSTTLNNISYIYLKTSNLMKAKSYGEESLKLASELKNPGFISNSSKVLSEVYFKLGDYKQAYLTQVLYKKMTDSLNNDKNKKAEIQKDLQYTYEKKATADNLKVEIERTEFKAKIEKEKNQRYFLYGGLGLVIIFSGFMFNRFKKTQKQNKIINQQKIEVEIKNKEVTLQKSLVEEKQKEIIDSINYAKRIQQAVLTGPEIWDKISEEHFILFKPKDIVSGDFYWAYNTPDGLSVFALADCTGHGVPGGFMSMLGNSFLNEIIVENKNVKTNEILNMLRAKIIAALEQKGDVQQQQDGMDISLCVWNKQNNMLEFSGANNPLWLLRENKIAEYKADKMPIGTFLEDEKPFSSTSIQLYKNDIIYLSTDGYADQFGGFNGKKLKYKAFLQLLAVNGNAEMSYQKTALDDAFESWKNNFMQVDDVTVIGIRI